MDNITQYNHSHIGSLFNKYSNKLYRFLYFKCNNKQLAEDLVSETFLKAMENIEKFRGDERGFYAWLCTIGHNLMINKSKKESRSEPNSKIFEYITDKYENIEELAEQDEQKLVIYKAVQNLMGEQKQVIELRYFNELELDEIAVIMKKSKGAIKQLLQRAYKNLEKILNED